MFSKYALDRGRRNLGVFVNFDGINWGKIKNSIKRLKNKTGKWTHKSKVSMW